MQSREACVGRLGECTSVKVRWWARTGSRVDSYPLGDGGRGGLGVEKSRGGVKRWTLFRGVGTLLPAQLERTDEGPTSSQHLLGEVQVHERLNLPPVNDILPRATPAFYSHGHLLILFNLSCQDKAGRLNEMIWRRDGINRTIRARVV